MRLKTIILFAIIALTSCTTTYRNIVETPIGPKLEQDTRILISTPKDGQYNTINYFGSGKILKGEIQKEVSKYTDYLEVLDNCHSYDSFDNSLSGDYFIESTILHWEDRNTEWSGRPDRIKIQISVYAMSTSKKITEYIFSGKSSVISFGGHHPEDLLEKPISDYFNKVFY